MKFSRILYSIFIIIFMSLNLSAKDIIAVMNFKNNTGDKSLNYLESSFAETISAALSKSRDVNVAERGQLGKILDEVSLEKSGLFSRRKMKKAGELTRADYLVIGAFTGNRKKIVLTIKVVNVDSGYVVDGQVLNGDENQVLGLIQNMAMTISAQLSGKGIGFLSVNTSPVKADIFVNGNMIGQSPVGSYKLPEGSHEVRALATGYIDESTTVSISKNKTASWNPNMVKQMGINKSHYSFSIHYIYPAESDLQAGYMGILDVGHTFDKFYLSIEAGYGLMPHDDTVDTSFGDVELERKYDMFLLAAHLGFVPITRKYYSVYVGGFVGYNYIRDSIKSDGSWEKEHSYKRTAFGARGGITLLPFSTISLFLDARIYYHPDAIIRDKYEGNGFFGLTSSEEEIGYNFVSIGFGVKYNY